MHPPSDATGPSPERPSHAAPHVTDAAKSADAAQPAEEWFDVVDEQDRVLRSAPRSEVHNCQLLHRAAHVWVFNSRRELLIHLRSLQKEEEPGKWTSSAAGHLSAGEPYAEAAVRELEEELGLIAPLIDLHKLPSGPEVGFEHTALFACQTDQTPQPDPEDISACEFVSLAEIERRVVAQPEQFTTPFRLLFQWLRHQELGPIWNRLAELREL